MPSVRSLFALAAAILALAGAPAGAQDQSIIVASTTSTQDSGLFAHILPLIRFELQPGLGVAAMKHNLVAAGVIRSARVRHPTSPLDPDSLRELNFLREWVAAVGIEAVRV